MNNERGMPIYVEIHRGHRSGQMRFGVLTGLIQELSYEDMNDLRQTFSVVIGLCEQAFRDGAERRHPTAQEINP